MAKKYLEKDVLQASLERLEIILTEFDNVYLSVSGGKDSSVMVQLANIVAKKVNKKFDVLFYRFRGTIQAYSGSHRRNEKTISNKGFLSYSSANGS